jgi:hypothetical protein
VKTVPHGLNEIRKTYGPIEIHDGKIIRPINWINDNIVRIVTPAFAECPRTPVHCHRLVANDLVAIFAEVVTLENKLKKPLIYTIDGCWVVRDQRGGAVISCHAWAIALDVNAARNPRGAKQSNQSQALIDCFLRRGWENGGQFPTPDWMHMQRATGY